MCESGPRSAKLAARSAFTLMELLVVVAVIAVLAAILIPALSSAKEQGKRAACLSNLHQLGVAIFSYAHDNPDRIPFGPNAPPFVSPTNFYPATGNPTSLISLTTGEPVGAGLLLQTYISKTPKVLFCPGADQKDNSDDQLAMVGTGQAQSSYYYRHGSNALPATPSSPDWDQYIKLSSLGTNRNNVNIRALMIDTQFPASAGFAAFEIYPRTHHQSKYSNILFSDGHAVASPNIKNRYTLNLGSVGAMNTAFSLILRILENADNEQ